ncbi:hypothetical protein [Synoicihabitans lomoniglobus]|uniref:Uncharacterized protein n=1 Tax=Synoicihabitans lomoniglobus TaxID=2909285 RepID=A0AAF0CML6_9BACT|nr:hypothetical protein [Opitutaceae bacterium LMO-M01]WED63456.1 hypothetical protein PXH66_14040 [Opitutaceae bacterium LMO-M01]
MPPPTNSPRAGYTVTGTVKNKANGNGVQDLHVLAYKHELIGAGKFLGIAVTKADGAFAIDFESSAFSAEVGLEPHVYFVVEDGGFELLNTASNAITIAEISTSGVDLLVDLTNDKLRQLINATPAPGWVGGFEAEKPAFAYPTPDLTSLPMLGNLENIDKLQRQQKVVWPEFSWETKPGQPDPQRCYQMFAPDISRLGYTDAGRVYSIICPQQGACSPLLGSINVEVTVTGNRGWANETTRSLAADMTVEGRIWFSPSAQKKDTVVMLANHFHQQGLPFPTCKANAIRISTYHPGNPDQPIFPLRKGSSTDFPIPDFAQHNGISWSLGHLGVTIGPLVKTGSVIVDDFNQMLLDVFNIASGNMLKDGNTLTWNVWFTAPETVDQTEWAEHAQKWRHSIDTDHGSPDGPGTHARYFDGTRYNFLKEDHEHEMQKVLSFIQTL